MRTLRRSKLWVRGTKEEKGAELVEAAVVLPLVILLVLGMFWLGRAYNSLQTLTRAAREGARLAVTPTCASCGNTFPAEGEVRAVIDASLLASSMDPSSVTNFSMQRQVVLNPGSVPEVRGVVISFNYPYNL
ncbi:MAG: TadE family protein, partial [Candidatus Acidiferrales bacterium]